MKKERFMETYIVRFTKFIRGVPYWKDERVFCQAEARDLADAWGAMLFEWAGWLYIKLSDGEWYPVRPLTY